MGGYGSGRRKAYPITSECLPLDTSFLLKRNLLTGKQLEQGGELTFTSSTKDIKDKVTETHHNLYCIVERYGDEAGEFSKWDAAGHITLIYGVKRGDQHTNSSQDIPLVVTHPNYGGVRWSPWLFLARPPRPVTCTGRASLSICLYWGPRQGSWWLWLAWRR